MKHPKDRQKTDKEDRKNKKRIGILKDLYKEAKDLAEAAEGSDEDLYNFFCSTLAVINYAKYLEEYRSLYRESLKKTLDKLQSHESSFVNNEKTRLKDKSIEFRERLEEDLMSSFLEDFENE